MYLFWCISSQRLLQWELTYVFEPYCQLQIYCIELYVWVIVLHWSLQAYICSLWPQLGSKFSKQPFTCKKLVSKTLISLLLLNQLQVKVYWIKAILVSGAIVTHSSILSLGRQSCCSSVFLIQWCYLWIRFWLAIHVHAKDFFLKTLIIPLSIILTN